ncbi:hypothetical protein E3P99_03474 [Wallemia hederae]|uniref:Uncharacterized protein n=1 Tax=Wallemia hederae TaxID=1540922 RepID=A0A4V4LSL2_9BASI|nr:hypothetical protein E3P99_03474 [Wallemia hederae]
MFKSITNQVVRNGRLRPQIDFSVSVSNGEVLVSGRNAFGQLGHPRSVERLPASTPVPNLGEHDVKSAHTSLSNVYIRTATGVLSAGLNTDNQLGRDEMQTLSEEFKAVAYDFKSRGGVRQLSANGDTCAALTNDGCVVGWGNSEYGGLCVVEDRGLLPTSLSHHLDQAGCTYVDKVSIAGAHSWFMDDSGGIYAVGLRSVDGKPAIFTTPSLLKLPANAVNVWSGVHHSVALLQDGSLFIDGPQLDSFEVLAEDDADTLLQLAHTNTLNITFGLNGILLHS